MTQLVEKHSVRLHDKRYKQLEQLCALSKNLYNSSIYDTRQHYFKNGNYKSYPQQAKDFARLNQKDYRALPPKISQQILRQAHNNFKSFFGLLKAKKNKNYNNTMKLPGYLPKDGKYLLIFPKDAISKNYVTNNKGIIEYTICPKGINLKIKSKVRNIDCIRILPRNNNFIIEVIYTIANNGLKNDNSRYASIDLGINNLVTLYSNCGDSLVISGRKIKSINRFSNKEVARLKSLLPKGVKSSKQINNIWDKRDKKLDWELHNISRFIVNHLVSEDINTLIIGYNKEWKQDIKIGKQNNQKFVFIPFIKLIQKLQYKCELAGIRVILTEESYTSKCSFLDKESIGKHSGYAGRRVKRGLYKTKNGIKINADVNGAGNIMRKVVPDAVVYGQGIVDCRNPRRIIINNNPPKIDNYS